MTAPTHRTVPVVPTDHMKIVGAGILRATTDSSREAAASWTYQMMLDAAPTPPSDLPQSLRDRVVEVVGEAVATLRPFSSKPMGGEGSAARLQQNDQIEAHRKLASLLLELKERGDG